VLISTKTKLLKALAGFHFATEASAVPVIGLVPTMGALHAGHTSLVARAASECDVVVVSVFVNPTQFGVGEDFKRYPRALETDVTLAKDAGADFIFAPSVEEIYPKTLPQVAIDPGEIARCWEGEQRPGHFPGVALVVVKLLNMVGAKRIYFGEKDFQQLRVVQQVFADLNISAEVCACPTIRDNDGIALSSRNAFLSKAEREAATSIPRALTQVQELVCNGELCAQRLQAEALTVLDGRLQVDYLALVDAQTLEPLSKLSPTVTGRLLVAVRAGATRLIDNCEVKAA
jgi:pantoate--beta-alanine ligase